MPAVAFLGREKGGLDREAEPVRVALVADGLGAVHGVSRTIEEIRDRGVPGFEVEVVGTDPRADRRLGAVAEVDVPIYPGMRSASPRVPAIAETLADGRYDLVHVCSPGPAGVAALLAGRLLGLPVAGRYHTELAAYAACAPATRSWPPGADGPAAFYGQCDVVLSPPRPPTPPARARRRPTDRPLGPRRRPGRFSPGAAASRAGADRRAVRRPPDAREGVDLLADAFLAARARDPRLHLVLAGGGPEEGALRGRLGGARRSSGGWTGDALPAPTPRPTCSCSARRPTRSARSSSRRRRRAAGRGGGRGRPGRLVADGRSGVLCPPRVDDLGGALVRSPARARRANGWRAAAWPRSPDGLGGQPRPPRGGWQRALDVS